MVNGNINLQFRHSNVPVAEATLVMVKTAQTWTSA